MENTQKINNAIGTVKAEIQMRKQVFRNKPFLLERKINEMNLVLELLEKLKMKETPVKLFE